jgi:DNA-binding CsgD family transcriptional regulator
VRLVGRDAEQRRVDEVLTAATSGRSGVLVVRGEAGIGKSALLDWAAQQAPPGALLARTTGVESGGEVPFRGLAELLAPLLVDLDDLPAAQAAALRTALGVADGPALEPLEVGLATLSLIGAAAEGAVLVALVDDAQWLDDASLSALLFAARRLDAERVALLVATRPDGPQDLRLPEVALAGLDPEHAAILLEPFCLAAAVVPRLVASTAGNPLALLQLPASLSALQRSGLEPLPDPLPVAPRIELAFGERIARLPAAAQGVLALAAADDDSDLAPVAAASALLGLALDDVEPAEADGLLQLEPGRFRFCHPLARAAAYQSIDAGRRVELHRALADALAGDAQRRAWHLAASSEPPDDAVADELERCAAAAAFRGARVAQSRALAAAARLASQPTRRAELLLEAGRGAFASGALARAKQLFDEALPLAGDPLLRAAVQKQRARVLDFEARSDEAEELLLAEVAALQERDPESAADLLALTANIHFGNYRPRAALDLAARSRELPRAGHRGDRAELTWAWACIQCGRSDEGDAAAARFAAAREADPSLRFAVDISIALIWSERYEQAARLLDREIDANRAASDHWMLVIALGYRAELEVRLGRPLPAAAAELEALSLIEGLDDSAAEPSSLSTLVVAEALAGHEAEARRHGERCRELCDRYAYEGARMHVDAGLAHLALALGRPQDAIELLVPGAERARRDGLVDPCVVPLAAGDLVEAHLVAGDARAAHEALADLERRARQTRRRAAAADLARLRLALAADDELDRRYAEAMVAHDRHPSPLERARTRLWYGRRLLRAGRPDEALASLRSARSAFDEAGARLWSRQADGLLAEAGELGDERPPTAAELLTARELQVALAVGRGATSRAAASALLLTPRTVEFHLANAYAKLGVRSRSQLARRLSSDGLLALAAPARAHG